MRAGLARPDGELSSPPAFPDANVNCREPDRDPGGHSHRAREGIDVVITTSPPSSIHLIGAAAKRATGALGGRPTRLARREPAPARGAAARPRERAVARKSPPRRARGPTRSSPSRRRSSRRRALHREGPVVTIPNGCDFDDFAGLSTALPERFRITHTGSFFGKRDPRPFLQRPRARPTSTWSRLRGRLPRGRPRVGRGARAGGSPGAHSLRAAAESLELQRDSEALLLLVPEAGGRGRGVLSGKVFEYSPPSGRSSPPFRPTAPRRT